MNTQEYYDFVKTLPVAKFFYKGDHSHPVRRTIIIVKQTADVITGYELREGRVVRNIRKAPIKSYRRDTISKISQIDRRRVLRRTTDQQNLKKTTLKRQTLQDLIKFGL